MPSTLFRGLGERTPHRSNHRVGRSYSVVRHSVINSTIPVFSSVITLMLTRRTMIHNIRPRRAHRVQISTRPLQYRSARRIHIHRRRCIITNIRRQLSYHSHLANTYHNLFSHFTKTIIRKRLLTIQRHLSPVTLR